MKRLFAIAVMVAAATSPLVAQAQPGRGGEQGQARDGVRAGRQVPLSAVLAQISARAPGRHLNTNMGDAGGRPAYFVQWQLPDGRVVMFVVDAESGRIISQQGG